jgi:hypothetical protein
MCNPCARKGRERSSYAVLGRSDPVYIVEAPYIETALKVSALIGTFGYDD